MSGNEEQAPPVPLLDDDAMDELFEFLDSDRVDSEALTLFGAHGFLMALAIAPAPTPAQVWVAEIFNGEPHFENSEQHDRLLAHLEALLTNAADVLESGHIPELPFDLDIEAGESPIDTPVGEWCAGFMTGVFMQDDAWFSEQEEQAAQLLLPFMALSELFEEEDEDLAAMASSHEQANHLARQLPELTLDLYLLYRVPAEKPKAHGPKKGAAQQKKGGQKKNRRR